MSDQSPKRRRIERIVLDSIHKSSFSFRRIPKELRNNREIMLQVARHHPHMIPRFPSSFLEQNRDIVLMAMHLPHTIPLCFPTSFLEKNREIVLIAMRRDASFFEFVPASFKDDPEIVTLAMVCIQCRREAFEFLDEKASVDFRRSLGKVAVDVARLQERCEEEIDFWDEPGEQPGNAARTFAEQVWQGGALEKLWLFKELAGKQALPVEVEKKILELSGLKQSVKEDQRSGPLFRDLWYSRKISSRMGGRASSIW